jgi:hypothetical protein
MARSFASALILPNISIISLSAYNFRSLPVNPSGLEQTGCSVRVLDVMHPFPFLALRWTPRAVHLDN